VRAIGEQRPGSVEAALAELHAAAARVDTVLSEHSVVVARARAALAQLDRKLAAAQSEGTLKFFNKSYRQYQLGCQQRGVGAMPYNVALGHLRKVLAGAAAGASIDGLIERVFERTSVEATSRVSFVAFSF
jgi:hypothetical protein